MMVVVDITTFLVGICGGIHRATHLAQNSNFLSLATSASAAAQVEYLPYSSKRFQSRTMTMNGR